MEADQRPKVQGVGLGGSSGAYNAFVYYHFFLAHNNDVGCFNLPALVSEWEEPNKIQIRLDQLRL